MAEILATRFNTLQQRLTAIMADSTSGAPTTGYGQSLNSAAYYPIVGNYAVNAGSTDIVSAAQYESLYIDLVRARVHQVGTAGFTIDPFVVGDYTTNTSSTDLVEELYISDLESLMTQMETDKFLVNGTQLSVSALTSSSRTATWNTSLTHSFNVNFASETAKRNFFNAGGQIRFGPAITYVGTDSKTIDWQSLLSTIGTVIFDYTSTYSTNSSGTGSAIGGNDNLLTATNQLIFRKYGSSYSSNNLAIYAKQNSVTQIQFTLIFSDSQVENVDEVVRGTLSSVVNTGLPDGSVTINGTPYNTVALTAPTAALVTAIT